MGIMFWDGVLRGGTTVLLLLLAWNFWRGRHASLTAVLEVLLTGSALCYLYLPALPAASNNTLWRVPPHLAGMAAPALFWRFDTTTHHDLHHNGSFAHNFGLYFTWWDRIMGTEHPQYRAIFREVTGRAPALGPGSDVANPGRPA
jgi:hypothetical protein